MKDKFLNTIENENSKRSYITIFNSVKKYEDKYNTPLENFDKFMLLDYVSNSFKGISKSSIAVKISCLKKYLEYVGNNSLDEFTDISDSLLEDKGNYLRLDEIIELCETHLINASDKAMIMLLYHGIKGKSQLTELRTLKVKDINLKLRTISLPTRTVIIEDNYTLEILKQTINEKYYHKYVDDDKLKAPSSFKYNLECEYLFKSKPSKRNNNGLNPYTFSALTSKLFRFSNMLDTTVQHIYQSGICNIIDNYQNKINNHLTIIDIDFYLKNILNLESISVNEIYNMLKNRHEKKEIKSI